VSNMPSKHIEHLMALGLTEVEARAYCELLRNGPATAYKLAGAIDRSPSNIYQILDSLCRKGAILGNDAEPRIFRAVPVAELLALLERGFQSHKEGAIASLSAIDSYAPDDRIYNLKTVEQVYERARSMIAAATEIVLFDLSAEPLRLLQMYLDQNAGRGIKVAGVAYGDVPKLRRVHAYAHPWQLVAKTWPGQQLTIVADARECLMALLAHGGETIRHAMWTDSVYFSCLQHSGLACEIQVAANKHGPNDPIVKLGLLTMPPPGLRTFTQQQGELPKAAKRSR